MLKSSGSIIIDAVVSGNIDHGPLSSSLTHSFSRPPNIPSPGLPSTSAPLSPFHQLPNFTAPSTRNRRRSRKLITKIFKAKMTARQEQVVVATDAISGTMIYEPILEEGIFRFDSSADDRTAAFPSLSFVDAKVRDMPITSHQVPAFIPTFKCVLGKQIVHLELPAGTSFYGTGEVSGQLERTGKRVFTWNTDAWGYGSGTTSLYQSHPWVLAVLPTGESLGILADTTRRCEIDLRRESRVQFAAPSSYPVITFGPFASPQNVLTSLSHAIGNLSSILAVLLH